MKRRIKVLTIVGTRPETIKLAPVIRALASQSERFESLTCTTAQHRDMVDDLARQFGLSLDYDLDVMRPNQSLSLLTSRLIEKLDALFDELRPDWVLVQGDTTTVMAASLVAFYRRIKIGHVEAGLRTYDRWSPFPEEINRRITDLLADLYFAPTPRSCELLESEGVSKEQIVLTGNTVVDALELLRPVWEQARNERGRDNKKRVLLTIHRRENHGDRFLDICRALRTLATRFSQQVEWMFPVHPNPNIREIAMQHLADLPSMLLVDPLPYESLLSQIARSDLIVTDSGGIQEEAPSFSVPVLVLRDHTERPEGIEAGVVKLVGCRSEDIVRDVTSLLTDATLYESMCGAKNPYGDGLAAERIVAAIARVEGLS